MKKLVLLFSVTGLLLLLTGATAVAQPCERDSNLLKTRQLLSPAPYSPDSPFYNLKVACINEPYNQSVTVLVPDTFTYLGFKVPIQSVSIPLTNAISNLPVGMVYSCDPPNCTFNALTLGCIRLHGTPSPANKPDTFDLGISVRVRTLLGEVPLVLPRDINPAYHYYLILRPQGQCQSSTSEPDGPFSVLRLMPNPTSGQTYVEAISTRSGIFWVEVFDIYGQLAQRQQTLLVEGENRFSVDVSALPAGAYFVVLRDENTHAVRRLIRM
ncbi:MAG: T9SS type A sorting domain-containing protein [Saprospiraceae bacterium]|nr:T9SS type A sorting domain-containing protein [Saprospiraceae bacterium]MDW8229544.1 T9SS type A sorting domain-containing protein [Saprospiraceae bacterium]